MARQVLKNVRLFLGQYDISGDFNQVQLGIDVEGLDATASLATAKVEAPGLESVSLGGKVFRQQNVATPLVEDILVGKRSLADVLLSVAPLGASVGDVAWFFKSALSQLDTAFVIGQLPVTDVKAMATGARLVRGTVLENKTATGAGTGTSYQLGAVSASQKIYAGLHVFSCSGGTLTVKLQSDDATGMASPTDRITFTAATGATSEFKELAGAITDDWWRESHALTGGSALFALVAGIL